MVLGFGEDHALARDEFRCLGLTAAGKRHLHRLYQGLTNVLNDLSPWGLCL